MFEQKARVLLSLSQDVLDRARVMAGKATAAFKLPVSLQIVLRALIGEGLKTLVLQCANTIDRRTVAPCRAKSVPRLRSRNVAPTDSMSAKSRRTRLEAFNALAIWSWTCCAWTLARTRRP